MKPQQLKISEINYNGTQTRWLIDEATVQLYAEAMKAGDEFPPVIVFSGADGFWMADGFHRLFATEECGKKSIDCEIRKGTRRDAVLYACGANSSHGLPRTNADKRNAVKIMLADQEWIKWSDKKVAQHCAVSDRMVADVRRELSTKVSQIDAERKVQRGDSEYTMNTAKIGKSADRVPDMAVAVEEDERPSEPETATLKQMKRLWRVLFEDEQAAFLKWVSR